MSIQEDAQIILEYSQTLYEHKDTIRVLLAELEDTQSQLTELRDALQTLMNYEGIIYNHGGVGAIMKANKALVGKG